MTTIVLADDHPIVRQGLVTLLTSEPGFAVVAEASNGLEALDVVERLQPDVLIIDVMMPGLNGLEVTRQVGQRAPNTRIIVLSMYSNEAYVLEAMRNGATGYVLKDSSAGELVQAVHQVVEGRRYLSQQLSERAIDAYVQRAKQTSIDRYDTLTSREREVFQLVAEGNTSAEIAERLSISPRTAETHRLNVMRKLGLRSQTELIRYALQRGVLPMDQ